MQMWHERLGHLNFNDLRQMVNKNVATGIKFKIGERQSCKICLKGKLSTLPFPERATKCKRPLKTVHSDICGPMRTESNGRGKYFVTFIDDYSRWCEVYILKTKSGVFQAFRSYQNLVEKQTECQIKALQFDNGKEYCSNIFAGYLRSHGIKRRFSAPYTPQQNGVNERKNRTLVEMARCMVLQSSLPSSFWAEAILWHAKVMSEERVIASRLLQAAENVSHEETAEEKNFTSLVRDTRRCFRRNEVASSPSRGRKRKRTFKKKVVLMKLAHADFFPSNSELKFLKQRGLGEPDTCLEIGREESSVEIMENIISLFNSHIQNLLRMCGFKLAKSDRSKRIHRIGDFQDGADLESKILQSKIIILPEKDFPCDLPIVEEQDPVSSQASSRNDPQPSTSRALSTTRGSDSDDFQPQQTSFRPHRNVRARENYVSRIQSRRIEESESEELDEDDNEISIIEESHANSYHVLLPSLPKDAETATIEVSRNNCVTDLLNIYKDEEILDKKLNVSFLGEVGIDGGGLTKELFNIFFEQSENILLQGEDCLVPYLPLNKRNEQDNFIYFGRILQHMLLLTQTIPSKLSRITLILIANPPGLMLRLSWNNYKSLELKFLSKYLED
ncbi:uncharacterized protein LOC112905330 [Agrilus planipennis]|uniref:Uncharacterized protein LOC112905330 n=1 Tax=Agrilus planipennis TaxID=224129 RepID=A0A7F5RBC8_AGRPL|nr:uncharacterized protein LOC112905330 [Agrilus planipennis]